MRVEVDHEVWGVDDDSFEDTLPPAVDRAPDPFDDEEEIVVVPRSRWPVLAFGALALSMFGGALALVAASLADTGATVEVAQPVVAPIPAAPALVEIGGEGELTPRRRAVRGSTRAAATRALPERVPTPVSGPVASGRSLLDATHGASTEASAPVERLPPLSVSALAPLSVGDLPPAE